MVLSAFPFAATAVAGTVPSTKANIPADNAEDPIVQSSSESLGRRGRAGEMKYAARRHAQSVYVRWCARLSAAVADGSDVRERRDHTGSGNTSASVGRVNTYRPAKNRASIFFRRIPRFPHVKTCGTRSYGKQFLAGNEQVHVSGLRVIPHGVK